MDVREKCLKTFPETSREFCCLETNMLETESTDRFLDQAHKPVVYIILQFKFFGDFLAWVTNVT